MATARRSTGVAVLAAVLTLLCVAVPVAGAASHPSVLVVGDSLEELTSPFLPKFLPGVKLTVNAVGGSNSYQILELFEASYEPSQSVIVFDAGTNDNPNYPQILAENLRKVAADVGNRCMVVPTIHGLSVGGVDSAGKNRVVAEFAASRPGTQTPNWAGFVARHPELMQADNLHPIEAGAEARARLIAQGVEACLAGETAAPRSHGPVLKSRPKPIPRVDKLESRQQAIVAAIAGAVIRQTAAQVGRREPLVAALSLLALERGG